MTGEDELLQVERVITRLITRFPTIPATNIEHCVRIVHKRFTDCRIRDFVPLLVEKSARSDITDLMSENSRNTEEDNRSAFPRAR
ncbi:hypothetical protein PXH69_21705 [Rhodococcus qingshengii]|uniref:Uncharacterized protein n=1 Tax=Rhodococcus qingshengii TaxID=334542 RepID=A0AAW6LLI4_RHOSG|nr:hypothetical protein [Rhodococcus qingshengii]MDE8647594.1 hypothetical protein [Rhodococcus qingshengii]